MNFNGLEKLKKISKTEPNNVRKTYVNFFQIKGNVILNNIMKTMTRNNTTPALKIEYDDKFFSYLPDRYLSLSNEDIKDIMRVKCTLKFLKPGKFFLTFLSSQ